MSIRSREVESTRYGGIGRERFVDWVAVEDPLEIRLGDTPLAVTMRTPGDDEDLVLGFLLTEAILLAPEEVREIEQVGQSTVAVRLRDTVEVEPSRFQRNMFVSSSCGVCGKASIEAVQLLARPARDFTVQRSVVASLTDRLREHQPTFDATGGLHAAGLFNLAGELLAAREDVGRHNAVDKVIGAAATQAWPLPQCLLAVSGRQSFEIVQKAGVVGIGGVVGVSAPSSLAVELAEAVGLLLVGFSREEHFNVYAGDARLTD
ncbi:MAG: formate dehydrogenase accessory sulfurtransferase FdhD [Gemmatimonadota bacterium]|nr:MAG: formate dehydrogenase accessory sulfurtransferase FdhD [Gemmatimonadota bacterium]